MPFGNAALSQTVMREGSVMIWSMGRHNRKTSWRGFYTGLPTWLINLWIWFVVFLSILSWIYFIGSK